MAKLGIVSGGMDSGDNDTPCQALARIDRAVNAKGGTIDPKEWRQLWATLHSDAADAGQPCPCGDTGKLSA